MKRLVGVGVVCWIAAWGMQEPDALVVPESYREVQVRQLEAQRTILLAMADSMPRSLYRDRATPMQRDFAEQLHHAADGVVLFSRAILGEPVPIAVDTAVVLDDPVAMRAYLNEVFDFAVAAVRTQSAARRNEMVDGPGRRMPRWQLWDEIHQHTIWTAGQMVANFRKHGMPPPAFVFF